MSNEILKETLTELLGKVTEELEASATAMRRSEDDVERARQNLQDAKLQEDCANNEDQHLRMKIKALMDYYNGLTERPEVPRDEINSLNAQQSKTFNKSQQSHMIVEQRKGEMSARESSLRLSQDNYKGLEKKYQDVIEQIQKLDTFNICYEA